MSKRKNRSAYAKSCGGPSPSSFASSRGYPCILITCERGAERRARLEMKDMLAYHLDKVLGSSAGRGSEDSDGSGSGSDSSDSDDDDSGKQQQRKPLSLDDELKSLRQEAKKERRGVGGKSARGIDVVDTGVTGLLIAFFTGCERTNFSAREKAAADAPGDGEGGGERRRSDDDADGGETGASAAATKKAKKTDEKPAAAATKPQAPSFPPTIVNSVVSSIISSISSPDDDTSPRSRYVNRLIPLSSTCYPSLPELRLAAAPVVSEMRRLASLSHPPKPGALLPSFSVQFSHRVCEGCPPRSEVVPCVAGLVPDDEFTVDLSDPDYTIVVEVCKNLAAVGLCEQYARRRKYNLLEINTEANNERHDRIDRASRRAEQDNEDDEDE